MLTLKDQKKAAKAFANKWVGVGDEKQHSQLFWIELLHTVFGIENPTDFIRFEQRVKLENISYIDAMIPATHTMIEQKSLGKSLTEPIRQSDGSHLTPLEQARRYSANLPYSERPRWIIGCNFSEFQILDMDNPNATPEIVYLKDLETEFYRLNFMVNIKDSHIEKELEISKTAGELVGKIYDGLLIQYKLNDKLSNEYILQNINKLCVRLVFCLYAEDAGLFGSRSLFHDYLHEFKPQHFRKALIELFRILDTPIDLRDPFEEENLLAFPYVNGNLFSELIEIPPFNEETINLILEEACTFDWSDISPTIFGGIFEGTLNPETRRHGGMHYTSIENIHKVIDPLFLDEYKEKFKVAMSERVLKKREEKLNELQTELASLTFFDPAAGSGNFLTETYLSLRRLENDILRETITDKSGSGILGFHEEEFNPIKIKIQQFYGIEINDFAVAVARTAMWIAEAQMFAETGDILNKEMDFLPLHSFNNIHEGNSLLIDWKDVVSPNELSYIIGNPPFVGSKYSSAEQKADMDKVMSPYSKKYRQLDYVTSWFVKASEFINDNNQLKCAFVSTNSITQGEQVAPFWNILKKFGVEIIFAHKTFKWTSDSLSSAAVHCIIIGFAKNGLVKVKQLFNNGQLTLCKSISPYLINSIDIIIDSSSKPLSAPRKMIAPNKPCDYNHLKIEPDEFQEFKKNCPESLKWIKRMVGATEFINNKERYCLWLCGISPRELKSMPMVLARVNACRDARLAAGTAESLKLAETPTVFREQINPDRYLIIPAVSSERRRYVPIGFLDGNTIPVMGTLIIPDADLVDFSVLNSNVHMAWMRTVAGRLKSDYRYSKDIVYNTFPYPELSSEQREILKKTAEAILHARTLYPDSSLADLYDNVTMPIELRLAHRNNDKAVMSVYGFSLKMTEEDCVAELMKLYEKLIKKQ